MAMNPIYALGKVQSGSILILTKFDQNCRSLTEYIPVFKSLSEAEMELTLMGNKSLNVLTFDSAEDLQRKHPECPVRYEFDLLFISEGGTA